MKRKKKKSGNENKLLEKIVFITAILNLIEVLIALAKELLN